MKYLIKGQVKRVYANKCWREICRVTVGCIDYFYEWMTLDGEINLVCYTKADVCHWIRVGLDETITVEGIV